MKRWQVEFDGASAGFVYADTLDAARRAAQAAYARVYAERGDTSKGLVRVVGEGAEVDDEVTEAKQVVSEVYEGLRLLPGMEMPAEKLRNAFVLLDVAAARLGVGTLGAAVRGDGDTELREKLAPVLECKTLPTNVKVTVQGQLEWIGLNTPDAERQRHELAIFQALWDAGIIDYRFVEPAACALYRAGALLAKRLEASGALRLERFPGVKDLDGLRAALRPYGKDAVSTIWAFTAKRAGPDEVQVLRPIVLQGDRVLAPALVMRGVQHDDEEVVAFDRTLFDAWLRLKTWTDGLHRLADPHLKDLQRQLLARTDTRIVEVRQGMAKAAKEKAPEVLPPDTARRDFLKFLIDQVHRIEDALAFLPDRSLRDAFAELVSKDISFRGAGAYLSKRFGIHIDTDVVEGADTSELAGRFKLEADAKVKPKTKTTRIHSVVVPCFTQDGVAIRPASVRTGDY